MIPFMITCAALAAMVGIAILILIAMNAWANAVRLPDALRETPMDLLNEISAPTDTEALEEFLHEVKEDDSRIKVFFKIHFKRNPGLTAIPPFLEMMNKRIPARGFYHKLSSFHFTQIAPLKRRQVRWLKQRTAYVEELHRLVHSGPLPRVSVYDDQMQLQKVDLSPYIMGLTKNFDLTDYDDDITSLNTAYWWMYVQDGNYAAARRMIADSLRLAMLMQADERGDSIWLAIWSLEHISRAFCIKMEKPSLPVEEFRELLAVMQETDERFFTRDYLSKQIAGIYLARRKDKVRAMASATSWRGRVYGWDLVLCDDEASHDEFIPKDFLPDRYSATIRLPWGGPNRKPIQITRYDRVLATSIRAMWNKIHCARNLKDFDRQVRQVIEESKAGYAIIRLAKYGAGSAHYLLAETYLRLARLGLLWRLDPQGTLALRDGDIAGNPNHPWRDPFTNEAFRINETATQTLIYSLGPGLVDQHGMVEYYPRILGYRKHIAGKRDGNLVIRLPRG